MPVSVDLYVMMWRRLPIQNMYEEMQMEDNWIQQSTLDVIVNKWQWMMMMTVDDNDEIKISLMSVDTNINNYRVLMDVRIWQ